MHWARERYLSLDDAIRRSQQQALLLYDVYTKQGWLVPEISMILHIVIANIPGN